MASQLNNGVSRTRFRAVVALIAVFVTVAGFILPTPGQPAAFAGPGSLINGVVWADTNRDGLRTTGEPVSAGVTVELLTSPGGTVAATTTSAANGTYSFANVADGNFVVRVTAPGSFRFPAAVSGANDFIRAGAPLPGQPERGVSAPFTIAGGTRVTALDAGMQPIADLVVQQLPMANACEGLALTGTPPFDAADGPGMDASSSNCVVRTTDTVMQQFAISLTGLPGGTTVPNVIAEYTIGPEQGARLELVGPGASGMPAGCLGAGSGAVPVSSVTNNADGSITVRCNVGTMSSTVAAMQLSYRFAGTTPIPSAARISLRAFAAAGEAGVSNTVTGPRVEVTGTAAWDLRKTRYVGNGSIDPGPTFTEQNFGAGMEAGYLVRYVFSMADMGGARGSDLNWPVAFTDVMPEFTGARITECRGANTADGLGITVNSPWRLNCPLNEVQGTDGWNVSAQPSNTADAVSIGYMVMTVFVPMAEMNRAIDPAWMPGGPNPTGTFDFDNRAQGTEGWKLNGDALNFGDGREPGWNGTGNNLVTIAASAAAPRWDLIKGFGGGPVITTHTIDGVAVSGVLVSYGMTVRDLAGADNVGPWLDRPVTFKDRMTSHPGAHLVDCFPTNTNTGVASCETGPQPADGWDMSFEPNQRGFDLREGSFWARFFIPMEQIPGDICATNVSINLRNEAIDSDGWTAGGELNNGTGFEPGWNGTTATGNNVDARSIRPSADQCGTLTGNKSFVRNGNTINGFPTFGGDNSAISFVSLSANNNRVIVPDLRLCDVFDVSVYSISGMATMGSFPSGVNVNPANYVIEYAVGPNTVNTQAGPRNTTTNLFPIDSSSLQTAARQCRDSAGPWSTNPAVDFGADWRDRVNMVRVRPVSPTHVEIGPFNAHLVFGLTTRTFYNGGPNAGEAIPSGVRTTNIGAWPTGTTGSNWGIGQREMFFTGMTLGVDKNATPTQYRPGESVVWNLNVSAGRTTAGATLREVQVVDTIPAGLHFDPACTQNLLPPNVTVSYDATTRQATFHAGDIPITSTTGGQWLFHQSVAGAPRLRICTTVDSLAQPGDSFVNNVLARASNAENQPTNTGTIQVVGTGQLGVTKVVDKPLVESGEAFTWSVDWGNTSTEIAFQPPDIIDVLPWNGDGNSASGSARDQYESDYSGIVELTGPLPAPTYVRGGTGVGNAVSGTWYYSLNAPPTLNHDPRNASNANPEAPGGVWRTAAEITDFADVTAVRFVSGEFLPVSSRVRALISMVSVSSDLDNVYVNRAMIFSGTFPDQPLLSSEPFVLMPGFTLGDLVFSDRNGNGRVDGNERGIPGVSVQVLNAAGDVVATRVTNSAGRWSVAALPAGTYTVRIPAAMFADGAPLEKFVVRTAGSGTALAPNEGADNNNTAAPDPQVNGLTSSPVTLSNVRTAGRLTGGNGPTGDDVAGLAGELIPDSFTAFTVDLALMPEPDIEIKKATNGDDAEVAPGPNVTVGGAVRWTYVVRNTGGVNLTDVTVTDDKVPSADIDCNGTDSNVVPGPIAPDATFTCVATGTATLGQYENTGTVRGLDPTLAPVSDEDLSHFFGIAPEVDIEKATNSEDADVPTGPNVTVGEDVRWTYVVRNTGNVPLTNITVTDDVVPAADIDCNGTGSNVIALLAVDDVITCAATGTATLGQYANLGTVTGNAPQTTDVNGIVVAGAQVSDEDWSHYFGITPQVDIEKSTNLEDADLPTGPNVTVGGEVRWTYVVRNNGNVPLTNIVVTDDVVPAEDIDCDNTGENTIAGPLAPDGIITCVATGMATRGQYANLGTVTAVGPESTDVDGEAVEGEEVDDEDWSHFFGITPSVDIEKATNGQDADVPTGPNVTVGGEVRWMYVVHNTGNVPLTDIVVTDDVVPAEDIDCENTGSNLIAGPLAVDDTVTCVATGTATLGQYANLGTVTAVGPATTDVNGMLVDGAPVDDEDWSHYFGIAPSVDIEKATNLQDADVPTGPTVNWETPVRWTYVVRNNGNVPLTDIVVTDDMVPAKDIDCEGTGENIIAGPLAADATITCVANGTAVLGQYANLGTVLAVGPETTDVNGVRVDGTEVADDDWAHYFGIQPAVDIEKAVNGDDADTPTGPLVAVGSEVRWTYVVRNTGDVPLRNIIVTDDMLDDADINCDGTGSNIIVGPITVDGIVTCVATGLATAGPYANTGTVLAAGPETTDVNGLVVEGAVVTDEDLAHYFGVAPQIDIEKATNGEDADAPIGPLVTVGGVVRWTYVVRNTGNVPVTDVVVTDDMVPAEDITCTAPDGTETSSNNFDGPLAPDEQFTCTATGTAIADQYANLGTVIALGPETTDVAGNTVPGVPVTDEDWSHYYGTTPRIAEPPANPPAGASGSGSPPVSGSGSLPVTGAEIGSLPVAAGGALIAGLLLLMLSRRRRTDDRS
ncbi:hypothetical protein ASD56_12450 [Microbacterium sp. Root166]|uniref:DUF7507 domain-containing protein n=1 Tax=Microbacterium sp. Root166 TaxID=1736478 RepID=UPI0006F33900|nr:SdrD B-like domain-containing protein [Microbacterium sp. Root166]KQZ83133.1 hypothetical protein ASD56_12450 [Microbacterium sp. Root166]